MRLLYILLLLISVLALILTPIGYCYLVEQGPEFLRLDDLVPLRVSAILTGIFLIISTVLSLIGIFETDWPKFKEVYLIRIATIVVYIAMGSICVDLFIDFFFRYNS